MSAFLVVADVAGHSPEQFVVDAETSAAATRLVHAWLAGHQSICLRQGEWVKSEDVSPKVDGATRPLEAEGASEPLSGSFFIDGTRVDSAG